VKKMIVPLFVLAAVGAALVLMLIIGSVKG
jgi:hypothetical protein